MSTHKSQSTTVANVYALVGGPMQDRELSYVEVSRARGTTRLFVDALEAGRDLGALTREFTRSRQKDLAHDLFWANQPAQALSLGLSLGGAAS